MARDRYRKVRAAVRKAERQAEELHKKEGGRIRNIRRQLVPAAKLEALHHINGKE